MTNDKITKMDLPLLMRKSALDAIIKMKKANTIRMIWALSKYANPYTLKIYLTPQRKETIIRELKISKSTFTNAIKELQESGYLLGEKGFYSFSKEYYGSLRLDDHYAKFEHLFSWEPDEKGD